MKLLNPLEQMFVDDGVQIGLKQGREQGIQQGIEQGIEQGLEAGRRQGALLVLERQLMRRFGPLPKAVSSKLAKASLTQLERWSDALEDATSLQQVFKRV